MQALRIVIDTVGKLALGPNWNTYYNSVVLALWLPIMIAFVYMHTKITRCASEVAARITETNKEEGQKIQSRAKAAKSGLIVLVATLVCTCPGIIYTIHLAGGNKTTPFVRTFVQYPIELLVLFTSVVDPIVYFLRLKSLRRATKDMFKSLWKRQRVGQE